MRTFLSITTGVLVALALVLFPARSPREVAIKRLERNLVVPIVGTPGRPVRLALEPIQGTGGPGLPPSGTLAADDVARLIGDVLRQDLEFEGAFEVMAVAPDHGLVGPTFRTGPSAPAGSEDPAVTAGLKPRPTFADRSLDADGLVTGSVWMSGTAFEADIRIYKVSTGEEAFARGYLAAAAPDAGRTPSTGGTPPSTGGTAALTGGTPILHMSEQRVRMVAHTIADEIHRAVAGVRGIARTRLAFVSDRGGMRRELGGMMRRFKEIWIADYDGANERRVTSDGDLDMTPTWSPDGRAIAYTSLRPGFQDIFITLLDEHRVLNPTRGTGTNRLPAWSPDGTRIAFATVRDGNEEIYVMNRDGSSERRLTRHPAIDTAPAWSPDGTQIAFTSNRTGSPQIWVMNADGSNPRALTREKYCDRPSWSPPPFNEIAYVSKTKTGFDIKVVDVGTGETRQLTFGHGFNESPAFSPNGRHIAFKTTRHGGEQIWVMSRTGEGLRQVTTIGNNTMPAWR